MFLVFATNNAHKLEEVQAILGDAFKVLSLHDIQCNEEIEESADSFEGNALLKARYIFENYKMPCFSDDSGLEVEALHNAPGIFSARYAGEQGNHEKNIDKLLLELKNEHNRKARFRTVLCFIDKDGEIKYFNGIINGTITLERHGNKGFGYDPVFMPDGYTMTFAEMSAAEKNNISHRARAVKELLNYLQQ
jgi:XTP/dITP diphosphohydrolase